MVWLKQGIERLRDLIHDDMTDGENGSTGTEVTEADTDLGSGIGVTNSALVKAKFTKGFSIEHTKAAGVATGTTIREFKTENATTALTKTAHAPVGVDAGTEVITTKQYLFIQSLQS